MWINIYIYIKPAVPRSNQAENDVFKQASDPRSTAALQAIKHLLPEAISLAEAAESWGCYLRKGALPLSRVSP